MARPSLSTRQRLLALAPLELVIIALGLRQLARTGAVLHVVGWMLIGGGVLTLIGFAIAWRDAARRPRD